MPRGPRPWARFDPFHRGDSAPVRESGVTRQELTVSSPAKLSLQSPSLSIVRPAEDEVAPDDTSSVATVLDGDESPTGVVVTRDLQPSFPSSGKDTTSIASRFQPSSPSSGRDTSGFSSQLQPSSPSSGKDNSGISTQDPYWPKSSSLGEERAPDFIDWGLHAKYFKPPGPGVTHDACQRNLSQRECYANELMDLSRTGAAASVPPKYSPKCRYMMEIAVKGGLSSAVQFRVEAMVSYTTPDETERPLKPHPCARPPPPTCLFQGRDQDNLPGKTRLVFPSVDDCLNLPRIPISSKLTPLLLCNESIFHDSLPLDEVVVHDRIPGASAFQSESLLHPRGPCCTDVRNRHTSSTPDPHPERHPDWPSNPPPHSVDVIQQHGLRHPDLHSTPAPHSVDVIQQHGLRPVAASLVSTTASIDTTVDSAVEQFVTVHSVDVDASDEGDEDDSDESAEHTLQDMPLRTAADLEDQAATELEDPTAAEVDDQPFTQIEDQTLAELEDHPEEDEQPLGESFLELEDRAEEREQSSERMEVAMPEFPDDDDGERPFGTSGAAQLAWASDMLEDRPGDDSERPSAPPTTFDAVKEPTQPSTTGVECPPTMSAVIEEPRQPNARSVGSRTKHTGSKPPGISRGRTPGAAAPRGDAHQQRGKHLKAGEEAPPIFSGWI